MNGNSFSLLVTAVFICLGICLALIGTGMAVSYGGRRRRCSQKTAARVEKNEEKPGKGKNAKSTRYYPVFTFQTGLKRVQLHCRVGSDKVKYEEGQEVALYYNPSDPQEYYIEGDRSSLWIGCGFLVLGILAALIGLNLRFHFLW